MIQPDFIRSRITELRLQKGVAEHRMSLDLGHSRSYMQSISSGRALPSMTEFFAICDYLDVTPQDFFNVDCSAPPLYNQLKDEAKNLSPQDLELLLHLVRRLQE